MKERLERPLLHDRPQILDARGTSMRLTLRFPSGATVRFGFFLALITWSMAVGKDLCWDLVNHQLYLPYSWVSGHYRTDLFGAGGQAYQNPLGYFPFYGMVRAGFPAWLIGLILSAVHALVVWPLDRIARLFWPADTASDFWCRVLALALCLVSPIFLIHVGTTSIDPLTALLVVWALALTLEAGSSTEARAGDGRRAAIVGVLLAVASAVKLSNAVFALVICALWLLKCLLGQVEYKRLFAGAVGMIVAFAASAGWWMAWLWQDFGNPVFPLFNNIFHSPFASEQALTTLRFLPDSAWGMVTRLAELAEYSNFVAFEVITPDFRPVLLAGAAVLAALVLGFRGGWRRLFSRATWSTPGVQLGVFMVLGYVLWMKTSGNARYAIPLFVLGGIALVRAMQQAFPLPAVKVVLLTVLLLQGANYGFLNAHRFTPASDWDAGPYISYDVPRRLREQPYLHLAIGNQTFASVAMFLNQDGAMSNPIGSIPYGLDGPLGERFKKLMDQWHGRTRMLLLAPDAIDPPDIDHVHNGFRALLYRIGLDVDWSDCEKIKLIGAEDEAKERTWATHNGLRPDRERDLLSCGVVYRTDKDPVADQQLVAANKVFEILEAACPKVFTPTPFVSEHGPTVWQRHYANSDTMLTVSSYDSTVSMTHFRMLNGVAFGSIDDVLNHRKAIQCPRIEYHTEQ
jgi:hypothetical protein